MTLESSEVQDSSWWISKRLKSFLVSSAFCHSTLPHFIRPMVRSHKFVPKINLYTPEIQWLHLLEVDDHDVEEYSNVFTMGKRLANNLLAQKVHFLSPTGKVLVDELAWLRLCGFDLASIRLDKSKYIRFQRNILRTASHWLPANCCRSLCCCWSPWPTYSSHENLWPTIENWICKQRPF